MNLNRVLVIGYLTRDPETKTFQSGARVCRLGLAVSNRKKNQATGQWENEPVWLDLEAWNRGENGRTADLLADLKKGAPLFVEGHLRLEQWTTQEGQNRSKLVIVVDNFQFLAPAQGQGGQQRPGGGYREGGGRQAPQNRPQGHGGYGQDVQTPFDAPEPGPGQGTPDEDLPF